VMRVRDVNANKMGGSKRMQEVINRFMPFPKRYKQVRTPCLHTIMV
jgi:hypothetical protein